MKMTLEGLSEVPGFTGGGIYCGIKKVAKPDLALIYSDRPCAAAGVFTKNQVVASSVTLSRKHVRGGKARAIIVNSGNANVCTGKKGEQSSLEILKATAKALNIPQKEVLIASTGKISEPLPVERIITAIPELTRRLSVQGCHHAAEAILTTDTCVKKVTVKGKVGDSLITLGGFAKGSGMIHPNMATMLAFLGTNARISPGLLKKSLKKSCDLSFNSITVDTTSTNDLVLILANGLAGNRLFSESSKEYNQFQDLLTAACTELAKMIVKDGEGATKFVALEIEGAKNGLHAKKIAYSIAQSPLVKTALFGEDANWGRIMAAIGCSGVPIKENKISISINRFPFVKNGIGLGGETETKVSRILKQKEYTIKVDLHLGRGSARVWTTDLSYDYIKINASYRS
ncbi:MAG: bifunctional glutamate N-acetyltransferase/amino-acid acetyltransferase ArgJ [Nitrospiria bacterium]